MHHDDAKRSSIIQAALNLARERGWNAITLADIAHAANLGLAELLQEFETKIGIFDGFRRQVDVELFKRLDAEKPQGTPREKLFDVVMTRLDVLQPHKEALRRISEDLRCRPVETAPLVCGSVNSLALMLQAAGIRTDGAEGCLKVSGTMGALRRLSRVWFSDGSDNGRTMAELDRALRRAEDRWNNYVAIRNGLCGMCGVFRPRRGSYRTDAPPPPVAPAPAPDAGGATPGPAPA